MKFLLHFIETIGIYLFLPLILYFFKGNLKIQQDFSLLDYYVIFGVIMFSILAQFTLYKYSETYKHANVVEIKETMIDKLIPKISETVYIYDIVYAIGLFAGILSLKNFKQAFYVIFFMILLNVILFMIYMIYPTKLEDKSREKDEKNAFLKEIQILDTTGNAWPSTHVSIAVFITCLLYPVFKNWSFLYLILNIISTLTTKQHYIPDVVSGLFLGSIYTYLVRFIFNKNNF